jgi:hypothetical protein
MVAPVMLGAKFIVSPVADAAAAPRKLQSFEAAVQADSAALSEVVSTVRVAAFEISKNAKRMNPQDANEIMNLLFPMLFSVPMIDESFFSQHAGRCLSSSFITNSDTADRERNRSFLMVKIAYFG